MNISEINTTNIFGMVADAKGVVVAVSGGSDSMCLLDILNNILPPLNIPFCVAHINHKLRGENSDNDEKFVISYCEKLKIKVFSKKIDVLELSEKTKQSIELTARNVRYDFFNEVAKKTGYTKIATAHNLNDSLETTILNLIRGTGINGLVGIPPIRDNIIRPLIKCTKLEIESYCKENEIPFVLDHTNLENDYARNKIRNLVIPIFEEVNENLLSNYSRMINSIKKDNDYLLQIAKDEYLKIKVENNAINLEEFNKLKEPIKYRILSIFINESVNLKLSYTRFYEILEKIENFIIKKSPQKIQLTQDTFIKIVYNDILIYTKKSSKVTLQKLNIGENKVGEKLVNITKQKNIHNLETTFSLDFDIVKKGLFVRTREIGDKICLPKQVTKTLKKIMIEKKIPEHLRESLLVFQTENGEIVYVENIGINEKFLVNHSKKADFKEEIFKNEDSLIYISIGGNNEK
ncbi:MAG: tRNA lysidine(34) synthetase TilS [Clostridia bacterium]